VSNTEMLRRLFLDEGSKCMGALLSMTKGGLVYG